jgi:hypothetical protein
MTPRPGPLPPLAEVTPPHHVFCTVHFYPGLSWGSARLRFLLVMAKGWGMNGRRVRICEYKIQRDSDCNVHGILSSIKAM